jgi:mevalonate kinase
MPVISGSAPGKIILFGEHAVVYDRPAIAIPVVQVRAKAFVEADMASSADHVLIDAPEVQLHSDLSRLPADHPLALAILGVQEELKLAHLPAVRIRISSTIPVAAGLGSGAAVSVAVIRALSGFLGVNLPNERVSALAFRVEQRLHGTPSGIDNTVVTTAQPIFYQKSSGFQSLRVKLPLTFIIADTGIKSPTREAVGDVRRLWEQSPALLEQHFDAITDIVLEARQVIETGTPNRLGALMSANHTYLQQMGVSCIALDRLVEASQAAGAEGAKLSGGGRGGNMIALVQAEKAEQVIEALQRAGALRTLITRLLPLDDRKGS